MEVINSLGFDPVAFILNVFGFLILLWLLNKFLFKPVGGLLEQRQRDISSTYDKLEADRRQMETLKADYEARLAAIEAEGRERINNMVKEAQAIRDQVINDASARSKEMIARAEQEIAREQELAFQTIRQQVVDLAMGAATKVIGDNLDESRQRRLIDEFISNGGSFDAALAQTATNGTARPIAVAAPEPTAAPSPVTTGGGGGGGISGMAAAALGVAAAAGAAIVAAVTSRGGDDGDGDNGGDNGDAPASSEDASAPAKPARARRSTKTTEATVDPSVPGGEAAGKPAESAE